MDLSEVKGQVDRDIENYSEVSDIPIKEIKRELVNDWNMLAYDVSRVSEIELK